jgi:hypothetical protein
LGVLCTVGGALVFLLILKYNSYIMFRLYCVFQTSMQVVVEGTNAFVQRTVDILRDRIYGTLEAAGRLDEFPEFNEHFDSFILPFDGLQSTFERNKYITQNHMYVVSIIVIMARCGDTASLHWACIYSDCHGD